LEVSQVRSEDKMAIDLQMVTLLFYHTGKEIQYKRVPDWCVETGCSLTHELALLG
jgi:hypothetical protein